MILNKNALHKVNAIDRVVNNSICWGRKSRIYLNLQKFVTHSFDTNFSWAWYANLCSCSVIVVNTRQQKAHVITNVHKSWSISMNKQIPANIAIHSPSRMKPKSYLCNCKCLLPPMLIESKFDFSRFAVSQHGAFHLPKQLKHNCDLFDDCLKCKRKTREQKTFPICGWGNHV